MRANGRVLFALLFACVGAGWAGQVRWIEGTYRLPALGYSIKIPTGLKGMTGDQSGPEHGVKIALPSGGKIVVFGEPNSLEWKTPADGVRHSLEWYRQECASSVQEVSPARVGKLSGAKGILRCQGRVLKLLLVFRFRSGGGPIYWLRLETIPSHESDDDAVFESVAASFRLIRWD